MKDKMKLELLSTPGSKVIAGVAITAFLKQVGPSQNDIADINSALSEAMENCMSHAYPDKVGTIYITATLTNNEVTITVKDCGVGIKNIKKARSPLHTTLPETHPGMGFTIMETFMDSAEVTSTYGKGTTVTLKRTMHVDNILSAIFD